MTKQELEKLMERVQSENDIHRKNMQIFIKSIIEKLDFFKDDLAEDCEYNDGIKAALNWFAKMLNGTNMCKIELLKDQKAEPPPKTRFKLIKGGLQNHETKNN